MIGRALRAVTDLDALGERTLTVDCDVLQADGGNPGRPRSPGAYVAARLACSKLVETREIARSPFRQAVAATSVGIVSGEPLLDLSYEEDFRAEVDFNVVMAQDGSLVEVQGSGEEAVFDGARWTRSGPCCSGDR